MRLGFGFRFACGIEWDMDWDPMFFEFMIIPKEYTFLLHHMCFSFTRKYT